MDTEHGFRSQDRLFAFALTAFAGLWLTAGEGTMYLLMLLALAQPVIWLARRPLQDLAWTFGLPVAASVGMLLVGGPGAVIAAVVASPWAVLSALDFSVWVMTACALGVLSGLRLYQWTHARGLAYRHAHGLSQDR